MNLSSETPCRFELSAFPPDSPDHSSRLSEFQLRFDPSSPPQPPFSPLRSLQRRPQAPQLKSKFLATYYDPIYRLLLVRGLGWALNEDPKPLMPIVFEGITDDQGLVGTTDSMMNYKNRSR